jgi:hypothetical protein
VDVTSAHRVGRSKAWHIRLARRNVKILTRSSRE